VSSCNRELSIQNSAQQIQPNVNEKGQYEKDAIKNEKSGVNLFCFLKGAFSSSNDH